MPDEISDTIFKEAVRWLAQLQDPDLDPAIRGEFERWLERDPRYARAYEEASHLWGALDNPVKEPGMDNKAAIAALIAQANPRKSSRLAGRTGSGLTIVAGVAIGLWWWNGGLDDLRADYVTAPGVHRHYVLEDGTGLDLNTDTAIAIDIKPGSRSLHLFRGEVFLTVAHDAKRPFMLTTNDGRIEDLGTAFNVRIKGDGTVVSLVEGKIAVSSLVDSSREVQLHADEEIAINRAGIGTSTAFDASATTAWRSDRMVFFRTPLGNVVDELNRYQRGHIMIFGSKLRTLPVTGVFSTKNTAESLHIIEATLGVSMFKITNSLTIIH